VCVDKTQHILTIGASSFDVDLPKDCDDEYWETDDPELAFKQPLGKPSKVAFFISLIRQQEIVAFALRTIVGLRVKNALRTYRLSFRMLTIYLQYTIKKSKVLLGFVGQEWEQRVVSQLDSALNQWVDSVPDHRT
jgi:hypothetical protein